MTEDRLKKVITVSQELAKELTRIRLVIKTVDKVNVLTKALVDAMRIKFIQDNPICVICNTTINLTYDHIVPQSLLEEFGIENHKTFDEDNSQVLCRKCNMYKSSRLDFNNPKTKQYLLKLLETVN